MAETLEAQLKKYGPSQLSFEEWKQAANEIRFYGQAKEDIFDILGYPVNPDDTPIKITYKGDKGGYDRRTGNRSKQAAVRSDKASVQTVGEDVKSVETQVRTCALGYWVARLRLLRKPVLSKRTLTVLYKLLQVVGRGGRLNQLNKGLAHKAKYV